MNGKPFNKILEDAVNSAPLILLGIKDSRTINEINNFLPYSTGFEIECNKQASFKEELFNKIPDILEVGIDMGEQRFRIPNGLKGLICLYNICEQLKLNSELNEGSGIHYHIDMTDSYDLLSEKFIEENENWILDELDSWEYKGNYNARKCKFMATHNWLRFQLSFKTAEFRIGEMSFDYSTLVKRIIHCNKIIKRLKIQLGFIDVRFEDINKEEQFKYLQQLKTKNFKLIKLQQMMDKLRIEEVEQKSKEELKQIISKRIIKL